MAKRSLGKGSKAENKVVDIVTELVLGKKAGEDIRGCPFITLADEEKL